MRLANFLQEICLAFESFVSCTAFFLSPPHPTPKPSAMYLCSGNNGTTNCFDSVSKAGGMEWAFLLGRNSRSRAVRQRDRCKPLQAEAVACVPGKLIAAEAEASRTPHRC